ncbi:acyl-protein synthetase [Desulfuribacillus stibiiarsenatis]|uniref:Acyl-protein synthetase n=1 Tax=Desulfuribacillus stibiiarsenatis TaxID=1390249 RepID=A0A1E5L9C1_9FIRM|nr:acyl-protein synthetase [Desulfuribacillus stibiiarsenatis]OEH86752.1 acyl-protein synthetase [Desulfuribacillus stibiiarsenatis]
MKRNINDSPYQLDSNEKQAYMLSILNDRLIHHYQNCSPYQRIVEKLFSITQYNTLTSYPYLPVGLFKTVKLASVPDDKIIKTLTSSGTTSKEVSKIYLDRENAMNQSKTLVQIVTDWIGKARLPMIIVDHKNVLKDRSSFNARGAGIVGFSQFGYDHFYLLDDNMIPDWEGLGKFLHKHGNDKIFIFGFTFMIWQYFYQVAVKEQITLSLGNSILIHGGGWKKLLENAVGTAEFRQCLEHQFGIQHIHNYYGMVEQVGSIFMECSEGFLHAPDYAEIIIRDPNNLSPVNIGVEGIVQTLSTLSSSYPGNSLLTEDLGTIHGKDDCKCGRKGTYFTISGRIPSAELRGCSDTHAYNSSFK